MFFYIKQLITIFFIDTKTDKFYFFCMYKNSKIPNKENLRKEANERYLNLPKQDY